MDIQPYTLLQCPFCGSLTAPRVLNNFDLEQYEDGPTIYTVVCSGQVGNGGCGASCGYSETEPEAIEAWNTRADE